MITIRKFKTEDYFEIERRHFDLLTYLNFPNPRSIACNLAKGPAYTAVSDGKIVASGGILPLWKGVGEAWIVSSDLVPKNKIAFVKAVADILGKLVKEKDFDRVQTTIDKDHAASIKWAERMGFINEGVMEKFIGGRDYIRYALIRR
jgi:hypothetical protein